MSALKRFFDGSVVGKNGKEVDMSNWFKNGKIIGLYFSAHWCPPCRSFTPKLGDFYRKLKETDKGDTFEIIFVSSDREEDSFKEYYKDMPWLALKYSERQTKADLTAQFGVKGIPTLVLVEGDTGNVITAKGREKVMADPEGFPWPPESLSNLLVGDVVNNSEEKIDISTAIKGKVLGLYFSAHWCPPCRSFTPQLVETYNKLKAAGKKFEIIFVSSDRDEKSFKEYYGLMPWLSLPFGDKRKDKLSDYFDVQGIPSLPLVDEDLKLITKEGRAAFSADPEGKDFPWLPKALNPLNEATASTVNETASLMYLTGAGKNKAAEAKSMLQGVADAYAKDASGPPKLAFFYESGEAEDLVDSLKNFLKLQEPVLAIANIPKQEKYVYSGKITKDAVKDLVKMFKDGKLTYTQI